MFVKLLRDVFIGNDQRGCFPGRLFDAVDLHGDPSLFLQNRHTGIPDATDHHKRFADMAFQGKFESIVCYFLGELPFHRRFDFKKTIRRGQTADSLMRTLKIVVSDIERQLLPKLIETADLRFVEKLLPQRPPEPFHFSIGLRMVGAADRMLDLVVAQIGSELVVPGPADELTAAVGQDFFRERVVTARFFQQIDGISYRLAMEQIQGDNITRIIIQIADDKDFFVVRHDEIHHVGVP